MKISTSASEAAESLPVRPTLALLAGLLLAMPASAVRVPGVYPLVPEAFGRAMRAAYAEVAERPDMNASVLPAVMPLTDKGFEALGPLVEQMRIVEIDADAFEALTARERRDVLLVAAEAARETVRTDAALAVRESDRALKRVEGTSESLLLGLDRRLAALGGTYAGYLPVGFLPRIEETRTSLRDRIEDLRQLGSDSP